MPQLVKGGKYVYGWSKVGEKGKIVIPPEAVKEYNLSKYKKVILLSGSTRSGGFGLTTLGLLENSPIAAVIKPLAQFEIPEGEVIQINGNPYCWVTLRQGTITVPVKTLMHYNVSPGDVLLLVRGSRLALGFAVKGPLIKEAKAHELEFFE